ILRIVLLLLFALSGKQVHAQMCSNLPCSMTPCQEVGYPNPCLATSNVQRTDNYHDFYWEDCCTQTPNYEVQILRLYNVSAATATTESEITAYIDWNKSFSYVTNRGLQWFRWATLMEG